MPRHILDESKIHPAVREAVTASQREVVDEVLAAVARNSVVVVGMGMNPFPRKARALLDEADIAYLYLEYGNYLNTWRKRNALKMWSGWPTFPMIFVKGQLIGGFTDLHKLLKSGELKQLLAVSR